MKIFPVVLALLYVLNNSCTIPRENRRLKKTTKEWREAPVVLCGYADTPFSGVFLTLRGNGKFEHESGGLLKSFAAGTWTNSKDTIKLIYLDSKQNSLRNQKVVIDRESSTLIFEGRSTPVQMRLRIMTNKL
jgi:hypothetical protein